MNKKCKKTSSFEHFQLLCNRKAQVTLFIILGLVILITIGIFLLVRSETMKVLVEKILLPEEVMPVREYVQNCLEETSREGINRLGALGRFIKIPDIVAKNPRAKIDLFPEAGAMLPLWYYDGNEYKPNLDEMQKRLADYVQDNIKKCIGDFSGFKAQFDIEELSEPSIRVSEGDLAEKDVTVHMIYRLNIKSRADQQETKMSLFNARLPIRLKRVFEVAEQIFNAENTNLFLEKQMIDLMSLNEDVVPITDVKFSCSPIVKRTAEIRKNVMNLAQYNIPNTIINDTKQRELRPYEWYAALHQTYDFDIKDAKDIAVEFRYDSGWGMDFYVSPNEGRIIRAEPLKLYDTVSTCIINYHYVYDLNFPVMISIIDSDTKDHESFVFNFAMPVIINDNEGAKVPDPKHIVFEKVVPSSEDYCDKYPKKTINIRAMNKVTYDDMNDVELSYRCITFECPIGNITLYRGLRTQVPECGGGVVTGKKNGYLDSEAIINTDKEDEVKVEMTPVKNINFTIMKIRADNPNIKYHMKNTKTAVITMTNEDYKHSSLGVYSSLEPDMNHIELLSQWNYVYNVDILLLDNDTITGGYNGDWEVKWRDFVTAKELVFYVYEDPTIKFKTGDELDMAQYELFTGIAALSADVPKPEFK